MRPGEQRHLTLDAVQHPIMRAGTGAVSDHVQTRNLARPRNRFRTAASKLPSSKQTSLLFQAFKCTPFFALINRLGYIYAKGPLQPLLNKLIHSGVDNVKVTNINNAPPPEEATFVSRDLDEFAQELLGFYSYDARHPGLSDLNLTVKPRRELCLLLVAHERLLWRRPCVLRNGVHILPTIRESNEH